MHAWRLVIVLIDLIRYRRANAQHDTTMPLNVSFLQDLLVTIAEQGRSYLPAVLTGGRKASIEELAEALVSGRGEASGVALARETLGRYRALTREQRREFFHWLVETLRPDAEGVARAAAGYIAAPGPESLAALQHAVENPRQEFFRRLNLAPGATAEIVAMRRDLLREPKGDAGAGGHRWRPAASARVLVQSGLSGAAPHRLADAGGNPRKDHPLRGRARDPGLGRSAPPPRAGRSALLRLLPPLAGRRAADLRRGGADDARCRRRSRRC